MPCSSIHHSIFLNMAIFHIIDIYGIQSKDILLPDDTGYLLDHLV